MLWLALHLPKLPLEVYTRGAQTPGALAVTQGSQVLLANASAAAAGVQPAMGPNAALALLPSLQLRPRCPEQEHQALTRLADWGLQYTSFVSLEPPGGLLLEIGGSLRLFGGLSPLLDRIRSDLDALGYSGIFGVAPTPRAAWMLALAGQEEPIADPRFLAQHLGHLPCSVLPLEAKQQQALRDLGLTRLADCLALPREGLARRLGRELLRTLDQALGKLPEPRQAWQPPPTFRSRLELPAEVEDCKQLVFALNRLLRELCGYLRGLDSGLQRYSLRLEHAQQTPTDLTVGLVRPSRALNHLLELGRERLEQLTLTAPVRALILASRDIRLLAPERPDLLGDEEPAERHWGTLVERLSARLGAGCVQGLQARPEHRPERAWQTSAPGDGGGSGRDHRPLWLLPRPLSLHQRGPQPLWHGPLRLQQGPERIESGWWDGEDVRRDYYVALNPQGARLWVFQERQPPRRWYLHGFFS